MQNIKTHSCTYVQDFDLSKLRKLEGNRSVSPSRVAKIERSVEKVGWITPTITINDRMEVIDGQGRVEVAKKYGLPVNVAIVKGLGIRDCVAMNIDQTNWNMIDFINSYAEQGIDDYVRFKELLDNNKEFNLQVVYMAATEKSSLDTKGLKDGRLVYTAENHRQATAKLQWLKPFAQVIKEARLKTPSTMCSALLYAWGQQWRIDMKRLYSVFSSYRFTERDTFADIHQALDFIDSLYNNKLKTTPRIFLEHWYVEDMAQSNSNYKARIKNGTYKFYTSYETA